MKEFEIISCSSFNYPFYPMIQTAENIVAIAYKELHEFDRTYMKM